MYAFVFPGQGSQAVGMGKDFYQNFQTARDVFHEVDEALSQKLSTLILDGSDSDLNLTANTQPALMAVSLAITKTLEAQSGSTIIDLANLVAGHSLGEYSALAAVGAMTLADTARLLRSRGMAMQDAVPLGMGGMVAVLGVDIDAAIRIAEGASQGQICSIANDNSPGQVVLSGHSEAMQRVLEIAKDHGASRAVRLNVSAPFHCVLMAPAADIMQHELEKVAMQDLTVTLMANVTADGVIHADRVKELLVQQVTGRVRWRESVAGFKKHKVQKVIEIGAGKVLTGLVKRIDPTLETMTINTPKDMDEVLQSLA